METVTIPKRKYEELRKKVRMLENIIDEERLTAAELRRLRRAEKSRTLTEKAAKKKYPRFFK